MFALLISELQNYLGFGQKWRVKFPLDKSNGNLSVLVPSSLKKKLDLMESVYTVIR